MGKESFPNLLSNTPERKYIELYRGDVIDAELFGEHSIERPKSAELQKVHPELYDYLMRKESAKKFNVSIIHIDATGDSTEKLVLKKLGVHDKKTLSEKGGEVIKEVLQSTTNELIEMARSDLIDLAKQMKEDPSSDLGKVDFFTAYSQLANHEEAAKKLGFEIFDIDNDDPKKWEASNSKQRNKVKNAISEVVPIKYFGQPAKIGLLSKESLFKLLEKD